MLESFLSLHDFIIWFIFMLYLLKLLLHLWLNSLVSLFPINGSQRFFKVLINILYFHIIWQNFLVYSSLWFDNFVLCSIVVPPKRQGFSKTFLCSVGPNSGWLLTQMPSSASLFYIKWPIGSSQRGIRSDDPLCSPI